MAAPRVVAIVAAYNEADIIEQTTRDLIEQGVDVYLLDNGSTDGTADRIRHLVGRGVLAIEQMSSDASTFRLSDILRRKEQLAETLDADWFINHDADELREAPWAGVTLAEALEQVGRDWNAVDFAVLNFWPTDDAFHPGDDLRHRFQYFELAQGWDKLQIRCWKKRPGVELVSTGGHEAKFDGQRVFPVRFLLRHYPIRSQAHGERKIFIDRTPRFAKTERELGWHVQYDGWTKGTRLVRDPSTLTKFDAAAIRLHLQLNHRVVEDLSARVAALETRIREAEVDARAVTARLAGSEAALAERAIYVRYLEQQHNELLADMHRIEQQLHDLHQSLSWKMTAPCRYALGLLRGERGRPVE